ncbi:DEAD/DEAH box helicase [Paenibacillus arenosi]|uniref:DEAD/DEAH box helicase family protein n=1 Tax=Paenibacillus arenosi TaxID=2774142 RepID=A0ABR9AYG7_9BACL|nr:helicase-related protein [Paenibacillus arenosi]MBD8498247.1 DEAD/DEAH box helicase family protein [Paenibacillus arenosi]
MLWLYAIKLVGRWELRFSLDWRVDVCHWGTTSCEETVCLDDYKVVLWYSRVPIDVALYAVEKYTQQSGMDRWDEESWNLYGEALVNSFGEQLKRLNGYVWLKARIFTNGEMIAIAAQLMRSKHSEFGKSGGADIYVRAVDETLESQMSVYGRLMSLLSGKALLESEIRSVVEHHQFVLSDEQLLGLLQQGVLDGHIELTNGVTGSDSGEGEAKGALSRQFRKMVSAICSNPAQGRPGLIQRSERCRRCGSRGEQLRGANCERCGSERCYICLGCLQLGRSRTCGLLIIGKRKDTRLHEQVVATAVSHHAEELHIKELLERFGLAPAQRDASQLALQYLEKHWRLEQEAKGEFLLWAVTGAGKTEMMYPLVAHALHRGGRVCIATPRRDVVLELKPRIAKAFANVRVVTLYGGSEERWDPGEVTLATTHQLMRFREAFDLVVVDELDAFPFHNNPMLERAARQACAPGGAFVYLSATPPKAMQRAVRRGRLAQAIVPVRYHREPLPVPGRLTMPAVARQIVGGRLHGRLVKVIHQSLKRGAQLFIFASRIRQINGIVRLLRAALPGYTVEGTSAADEERTEKVQQFRNGAITLLVTTTILERGVTVPKSDVIVLDADDKLFDASSLVQMAGRAGRSKDDPHGLVYFAAPQWTKPQREAVAQIKRMNRLAKRGGYLRTEGAL